MNLNIIGSDIQSVRMGHIRHPLYERRSIEPRHSLHIARLIKNSANPALPEHSSSHDKACCHGIINQGRTTPHRPPPVARRRTARPDAAPPAAAACRLPVTPPALVGLLRRLHLSADFLTVGARDD
jgi:hypothetical protein